MLKILEKFKKIKKGNDFKGIYGAEWDLVKEAQNVGHDEGLAQGRIQNKLEIAKKLISKNFKIEELSEINGLSIDELNTLNQ